MKKLALITVAMLALATPALAVDFDQNVQTFDHKDFVDQSGKGVEMRLGTVIENSLLSDPAQGKDEKNKRFWLAVKIHDKGKDLVLTPEDIVLIKDSLAATQPTAIMGQAMRLIDPSYAPK